MIASDLDDNVPRQLSGSLNRAPVILLQDLPERSADELQTAF